MLLTLTDHLTCPRCGPTAGLILFMERSEARRVVSGALGCPSCRTQYPIVERVADLRVGPEGRKDDGSGADGSEAGGSGADGSEAGGSGADGSEAGGDAERLALRVAALLELGDGRGFVLLDGPQSLGVGAALGALAPDVEPVVVIGPGEADAAGRSAVSAFLGSGAMPMADRTMRGVAWLGGTPDHARLRELVRVCRPTGRVVIESAGLPGSLDDVAALLESLGARVRARDATGMVAVVL